MIFVYVLLYLLLGFASLFIISRDEESDEFEIEELRGLAVFAWPIFLLMYLPKLIFGKLFSKLTYMVVYGRKKRD